MLFGLAFVALFPKSNDGDGQFVPLRPALSIGIRNDRLFFQCCHAREERVDMGHLLQRSKPVIFAANVDDVDILQLGGQIECLFGRVASMRLVLPVRVV